jgi:hypothetical protein
MGACGIGAGGGDGVVVGGGGGGSEGGDDGGGEGWVAGLVGGAALCRAIGCGVTRATGDGRTSARFEEFDRAGAWRGRVAIAGACTTLRPASAPGPGASATPGGPAGVERRRGIRAPPPTATASRSAATIRSLRLMLFPPPADNFPTGTIGRRDGSLEIQGV